MFIERPCKKSLLIIISLLFLNITNAYSKEKSRDPFNNPELEFIDVKPNIKIANKSTKELPLLELKTYRLKHISAKKVQEIIIKAHGSGFLSTFGSLTIDPMSNTLIVKDIEGIIKQLNAIVATLDKPSQQIMIEARIVNFDDGALEEFGTSWQVRAGRGKWDSSDKHREQKQNGSHFALPSAPSLSLNLTGISGFNALSQLDVTLSAYESEARAEVLSKPRLMASNQQTSIIEQGTEIPYSEISDKGNVSTSFKKANLSLEVTPQILANNKIELYLRLTQDKPGETVRTGIGEAVTISTQRIETQVTTLSGNTIVLGGIYQTTDSNIVEKVPVLGDIPLIGLLFQKNHKKRSKRELVIFLTPVIINN